MHWTPSTANALTTAWIKKEGRMWNVYVNGQLVEGGFFTRDAAQATADYYLRINGLPKETS